MTEVPRFKGLEIELHKFSGARVLRVVHPGSQDIDEHKHDWAYIGIYTLGRYQECFEDGEADMSGPSVVLHPPGRPHADIVRDEGLETLTVEFDSAWLRRHGFGIRLDRSSIWQGGPTALAARGLVAVLGDPSSTESQIGTATSHFLHHALSIGIVRQPAWLKAARRSIEAGVASVAQLSERLDLNPAWLARAYRHATGEGVHETTRRLRVERAASLLRRSDEQLADVAIASGFCDQSHMNRCFRALLGRTPVQVRNERLA